MTTVYRFFNTDNSSHFFSSNYLEKYNTLFSLPHYTYEGINFEVDDDGMYVSNTYRFFNSTSGVHFYTASLAEQVYISNNLKQFKYEGHGYNVSTEASGLNSAPVYRFYRYDTDSHFFTSSELEKDNIVNNLSDNYRFEGIAFYGSGQPDTAVTQADSDELSLINAFDEAWYLSAYPDVADVVNSGAISAEDHFNNYGKSEGRLGSSYANLAGDDVPDSNNSITVAGVINGGAGDDDLSQSATRPYRAYGETGNDTISRADNMNGGSGDDTYYVSRSTQVVTEATDAGNDTVIFTAEVAFPNLVVDLNDFQNIENLTFSATSSFVSGHYAITGTENADTITTGTNSTTITGSFMTPVISSGVSFTFDGAGGNDVITTGGSGTVTLGTGLDAIYIDAPDGGGNPTSSVDLYITDFEATLGGRINFENYGSQTFSFEIFDDADKGGTIRYTSSSDNTYEFSFKNYSADQISSDWFVF